MNKNPRIFVTGLTSSPIHAMEHNNLGNYLVAETFFENLRAKFPCAAIYTSIQMSKEFNKRYALIPCRHKRFWAFGRTALVHTLFDMMAGLAAYAGRTAFAGLAAYAGRTAFAGPAAYAGLKIVANALPLSRQVSRADIIIDISGDLFGDNSNNRRFWLGWAYLLLYRLFGKKTVMAACSLGPFKKFMRAGAAGFVLKGIDIITLRETESLRVLGESGITLNNLIPLACPSVLFRPADKKTKNNILKNEPRLRECLKTGRPVMGLIICGWNMPKGPFNLWPRQDEDFDFFVALVTKILKAHDNLDICIMSHQNRVNTRGRLMPGTDHLLARHIIKLLPHIYKNRVFMPRGLYNARESSALIESFTYLVSGRIHGAMQGFIRSVPLAVIDYGHEPKAHKVKGFAKNMGIEELVCNPMDCEDTFKKIDSLISNTDFYKEKTKAALIRARKRAYQNFEVIKEVLNRQN
jgi:colanic acid/amylovoran biosynthesis protein